MMKVISLLVVVGMACAAPERGKCILFNLLSFPLITDWIPLITDWYWQFWEFFFPSKLIFEEFFSAKRQLVSANTHCSKYIPVIQDIPILRFLKFLEICQKPRVIHIDPQISHVGQFRKMAWFNHVYLCVCWLFLNK